MALSKDQALQLTEDELRFVQAAEAYIDLKLVSSYGDDLWDPYIVYSDLLEATGRKETPRQVVMEYLADLYRKVGWEVSLDPYGDDEPPNLALR